MWGSYGSLTNLGTIREQKGGLAGMLLGMRHSPGMSGQTFYGMRCKGK
jgi:hypothetical protein